MKCMTLRRIHLWTAVAVGAMALVATSAIVPSEDLYQAKAIGEQLPAVKITNERTTRDVQVAGSEYTLVHFWAAYDAESRAENVAYSKYMATVAPTSGLSYQAVSLDVDADVYRQTLAFDGVEESKAQTLVEADKREQVIELCGQSQAFHSYLVDKAGKIVAVNPTTSELDKFVRS